MAFSSLMLVFLLKKANIHRQQMALQICNNNNGNLPLGHLFISASFLQKSTNNPNAVVKSPPTTNEPQDPDSSQFNSFQFWRNPLPSIENDLLELLVRNPTTSKTLPQSLQTKKIIFLSFLLSRLQMPSQSQTN